MIVLIPSFEPTSRLAAVVAGIKHELPVAEVLVVDDGSGPDYGEQFVAATRAGAQVIGYPHNHGKGYALRFGFAHIEHEYPGQGVVTADGDGQHGAVDIARIAGILRVSDDATLLLGCRRFDGEVPWRSRVGNRVARILFRVAAGYTVTDTQTGLRGFPPGMLSWLQHISGDRFEYELNVLLRGEAAGWRVREVIIETVYLDGNATSHFRPVRDSVRVVAPLFRFTLSSLAAFTVDVLLLQAFVALTGWLVPSIIAARVGSASLNFAVNRRAVFRDSSAGVRNSLARYALLALTLLAANIAVMAVLTGVGLPLLLAKLITEVTLYCASFVVQRSVVYAPTPRLRHAAPPAPAFTGNTLTAQKNRQAPRG